MTIKELLAQVLNDETLKFARVIRALPADKLNYKPDEKSRTAFELARLIAQEIQAMHHILVNGSINWTSHKFTPFRIIEDIATDIEMRMPALAATVSKLDDATWEAEGRMEGGGEPWIMPRGLMVFHLFLDLVHHRGQLSTYIRPMGGKVPAIYGPSADSVE